MVNAPETSVKLSKFVAEYHKFTAFFIKKNIFEAATLPKIFNNYWDTCITYEKSYYARLNYLYNNPVKHRYVQRAHEYEWGSFYFRYRNEKSYIETLIQKFPCDALKMNDDY